MGKGHFIPVMVLAAVALQAAAQTRPAPWPAATPVPERSASRPGDALQEAEELLQKQRYSEAKEKLQALIGTQAKNPQAWFDLGYTHSHLGETKDAVAAYRKAVELEPNWFEANLNLGIDLTKSGDPASAVPVLRHAVELKPSSKGSAQQVSGRAQLALADALEKTKADPRGAAAAYDKAAEMNSDPELTVRAGDLLLAAGDTAGAEQRYRKTAEAGNARGMAQLVDLLIRQKRYNDAETWLRKYVEQNPQDANARVQMARLLVAEGNKPEAIAMLQPLSGPAAGPALNRELAGLYLENKQYAEAMPLLRQALEKNANDPQLRLDLGIALLHQLKYAEAEAELMQAIRLKPDSAEALGYLAEAARQNQHDELAIRALDTRAKLAPETPFTYFLRATAYDNLRAYKQAIENYKQFLAVAGGRYPDQEFQARHRLKAIEPK
jgi:Flp pilus assembly protein TadD